jgi:nitrous oxide reductase accessory protein NosL
MPALVIMDEIGMFSQMMVSNYTGPSASIVLAKKSQIEQEQSVAIILEKAY